MLDCCPVLDFDEGDLNEAAELAASFNPHRSQPGLRDGVCVPLHCRPRVMSERAAVLEWNKALFREGDGGLRQTIATARHSKLDAIDDVLSVLIVAAREDRRGHMAPPWVHSCARSARSVT